MARELAIFGRMERGRDSAPGAGLAAPTADVAGFCGDARGESAAAVGMAGGAREEQALLGRVFGDGFRVEKAQLRQQKHKDS